MFYMDVYSIEHDLKFSLYWRVNLFWIPCLHLLSAGLTDMHHYTKFYVVLEITPGPSWMKHSPSYIPRPTSLKKNIHVEGEAS